MCSTLKRGRALSLNRINRIIELRRKLNMQMTWRWYGEGNDQIKLSDIKQIPGVEGILS